MENMQIMTHYDMKTVIDKRLKADEALIFPV